jgi:hypothetical protein
MVQKNGWQTMKDQKWQKDGSERGTVFRSGPYPRFNN